MPLFLRGREKEGGESLGDKKCTEFCFFNLNKYRYRIDPNMLEGQINAEVPLSFIDVNVTLKN